MFDALSERRLAAIILGDVVGYSRLMGIDEVATMTALKAHRHELIMPALAAYRGRMVGATGDANLMEFGSAVDAVSCAVMVQRKMITRNLGVPEERRLRFRLGINLGDIVIDGEEIYGDGVNVAARLESLCEPGGLCVSRSIEEQVRGKVSFPFDDGGERQLKNISHPIRIYHLSAEFIATLPETALPAGRKRSAAPHGRVGPGTILTSTYQIDEVIGTGGMGEIFKGHEIHSGGLVAIKVIRVDMMNNETALALFQREARVLKDIYHDAIVRYYMFSFDPDAQRHYLAMEYVDGIPLSTMLKQGPLSFDAVTALRKRVASGLQVAHERGIVHRDVSPDNIIVPGADVGRAKIIDFGIARATTIGGGTIIGDGLAGKYNYMSPEQLGLAGSEVTPRSDIYSFGLVLAEVCLGGAIDMGGSQAEVIEKRRTVPDLTGVDSRLRPLIARMLEPDPGGRPASMAEVAAWLGDEAPPLLARPRDAEPPKPFPPPRQRVENQKTPSRPVERWIIGGAVGLALILGAGVLGYEALLAPVPKRHDDNGPKLPPGPPLDSSQSDVKKTENKGELPPSPPPVKPPETLPPVTPPQTQQTTTQSADNQNQQQTIQDPGEGSDPPITPPPVAPPPPVSAERVVDYLKAYQAGGCLFAQPGKITSTSAAIDGFAQSKQALEALDEAVTQFIGFSPDISGHQIWPLQCPALDFLRQVKTDDRALKLVLKSNRIGRDQALAGIVQDQMPRSIALLQVRDDGTVVNMSKALKPDGTAKVFDLHVARGAGTGAAPQLLIVVASTHPLEALASVVDIPADQIFKSLTEEAARKGDILSAQTKAFLYGG